MKFIKPKDMENLLLKYFESRIKTIEDSREPGPVITISREYGCPSKILAQVLVDKLNFVEKSLKPHHEQWKWIGRELLEESARDLQVDPEHINHVFDYHERTIIDDILAATKKDGSYKSDFAIKRSMAKVIHTMSMKGHVVIVGRAGVVVNKDIKKSLHIRLMAPLEWRITRVMQVYNLSKDDALEMITTKDANRKRFLEYYQGQKFQIQIFDSLFNCAFLSLEDIADSIILQAGLRKML